nr:alpha/beta hydrolase [Tomitella fengzijianii]
MLLLHGLMGRGSTWAPHVGWLRQYGHVYTLDAAWHRGRDWADPQAGPAPADTMEAGGDAEPEGDVEPEGDALHTERFVADAAAALEAVGGGPAVVIGHSMGGLHAWCLAAARPDLVEAVVVEDMAPDFYGWTTGPWDAWFQSWPEEFTREQATGMFGEVAGRYFLDSFDRTADGWRLHGRIHVWQSIAQHWGTRTYWRQWSQVRCPALLIEAGFTMTPEGQMRRMADEDRGPGAVTRYVRVADAGHLVQADAPDEYRGAVEAFLSEPAPGPA